MLTSNDLEQAANLKGKPVLYTRANMAPARVVVVDYRVNFGRIEYLVRDEAKGERWVRSANIQPK